MIKGIIFDLDGTILYTLKGIANSCNQALKKFNYKQKSIKEITRALGRGGENLIKELVPKDISEEDFNKVYNYYNEYYFENYLYKTKPYFMVQNVLNYFKKQNLIMGVVSNKQHPITRELVKYFFSNKISFVTGAYEDRPLKPDTYLPNLFLDKFDLKANEVIYFGDSEVDVKAAKNLNMKFIGVSWGYRDIDLLIKEGCDTIIDHPYQMKTIVKKMLKND